MRARLLLLAFLLAAAPAQAQVSPSFYDYARPELNWQTIETEHFNIIYHLDEQGKGSIRTAQVVARVAEEVFEPITALYDLRPTTRVSIILKDFQDYSNGAAYFFDNKIEIWAPSLDSPLRGDHNWLRNVIAHEFTHLIQVQKTMKASRRTPFYYFQLLDYEDVKRPDVLYGYPNVIVTYPIPVLNNPAWLAEGTAQYQRAFMDYDRWDTHRDMLLRTRVLAGEELSLADMGGFYSHTSLGRESVYNHGFAFTSYLAGRFGEESLRDLSRALGRWSNWNVERALKEATGLPGRRVYDEWMEELRAEYAARTAGIREHAVEGRLVEPEGSSNFYPRLSPDGRRLAYVSNRGEDFNLSSLYVRDLESGEVFSHALDGAGKMEAGYTCAFGHRLKTGVGGSFSWRPDGGAIVYARSKDTPEGYFYSDLYVLDVETRKPSRLTHELRAASPAYAPDGERIAAIVQSDGTADLYLVDAATGDATRMTDFRDGTQVTDPAWHPSGEWIYFGVSRQGGRDLYRIAAAGGETEVVMATGADERSPAFSRDGEFLYFSSDASGIFNVYRVPVGGDGLLAALKGAGDSVVAGDSAVAGVAASADGGGSTVASPGGPSAPRSADPVRLTNVVGGAFMPDVGPGGELAFARYDWDGYKIALVDEAAESSVAAAYSPPPVLLKGDAPAAGAARWVHLNNFDDSDLRPVDSPAALAENGALESGDYGNVFTSFSFFPTVRLDQYVSRKRGTLDARLADRTRGETLLRNTKVGLYATSREVLEEMSMLGGVLVGPASREAESASDFLSPSHLLKLERDAFLLFDYKKGFGVLPKRWSPQVSIELFNIRRNVENGLSIEEFPCTACFPDTTLANLAYSLWEAGIYARGKVNKSLLVELGYRYSPYRVVTERFFSKEFDQYIPESSSRYYIGQAVSAKGYFEAMHPHRHDDVVPEGLRVEAGYEFESGQLLDRFDIEDGMLVPNYAEYGNHRLTLDSRFGMRLPGRISGAAHGIGLRLRGSTLLGAEVDDFFNDYVGGLIGARGYPFYALGGNETLWLQAAYHVPLLPDLRSQFLFAYFDKLYARLYADAALAWSGDWPGLGALRRDVGAELRLGLGSFYLFPTAVFLSGTYGLDAFDFKLDEGFLTPDGRNTVRYGGELQWHFGVLFGFDL